MLRCELIDSFGEVHSCLMKNVSRRGLGGSGCNRLAPGQRVTVILPVVGALAGTVRWSSGEKFGINLDCEIDPDVIRAAATAPMDASGMRKFEVAPMHRPSNDWRRPGLRIA